MWAPEKGGGKAKGMGPRGKYAFKVLCPDALVTCVLGKRGAYKDELQAESQCKIVLSNREEYYPTTNSRILVVYGPTTENVMIVLNKIIDKVIECGDEEMKNAPADPEFLGKGPGEYLFRAAISEKMFPGLIGSKGANITAIRNEFAAKVFIDNDRLQGHQRVRVIAEPDGLRKAVNRIHEYVQQHVEESWFNEWAMTRSFDNTAITKWEGERERSPRRGGGGSWNAEHSTIVPSEASDLGYEMSTIANEFPADSLDFEHIITCDLPIKKVSALIGKKGEYAKKVRAETGTQIKFSQENTDGLQTLEIKGPLLSCYAAHALLMRRYHETEVPAPAALEDEGKMQKIQELQKQMAELQQKLMMVNSGR